MHKTSSQAVAYTQQLLEFLPSFPRTVEVALAPPFSALSEVSRLLKASPLKLAAQNSHWEDEGAYTGEVSPPMLKELGCTYVILGHSERRRYFAETDALINRKIHGVIRHGLHPILCIGETLEEREAGRTHAVIDSQLETCLEGLSVTQLHSVTIAYEPVWAIGTGRAATVDQTSDVHARIRSRIEQNWGTGVSTIRIIYGGSVTPENASKLFVSPQINGALVGKACLDPETFARIVCAMPADLTN